MPAGDVAGAAAIAELAEGPRRAIVQGRAVRGLAVEALVDVAANDLGQRQSALSGLRPKASRLLRRQLNLGANHDLSVITP